jgi:prolyl oligopeptidase
MSTRLRSLPAAATSLGFAVVATSAAVASPPPPTEARPLVETIHGFEVRDDYRWLEPLEVESEAVRDWTTTQNDYTRSILDDLPWRGELESRLGQLMQVGSVSAPVMRGTHYFYTQRTGDQNQPVLLVRNGPDGEPRTLLDVNTLDAKGLYALDWFVPSPDGRVVAFGLSYAGDEMTVLRLMDTATGQWLSDEITGKINFGGWSPTGDGFLYGRLQDPSDAYSRAWLYHEVGRHHRHDPLLYLQEDPSIIPGAQLSDNGRWIVLQLFQGWARQDLHVYDAVSWLETGTAERVAIAEGLDARFAPMEVIGDTLYFFTTHEAPNGRLMAVDLRSPSMDAWRDVIPHREDAVLTGVSLAGPLFVAGYEKDASTRLELFTTTGAPMGEVPLPGIGQASISTARDRTEAFLSFASFNEPNSIYRIDLLAGGRELWARPEVPVDPESIVVTQEFAVSRDGTRVPMFIVHRRDLEPDGSTPTLMYGYGGFDISILPSFNATRFPWLEAGGIYVSVNLRGGGEYGEAWHRGGMLDRKQNVYDDLYAAAEHLVAEGYTSPANLAVLGGSNGGLLTGVAATQRPDLWAAAISAVPLLDMVRFPQFLMARFWIPEYGDPSKPEDLSWIIRYSPYHNVQAGRQYPAMLITAGENDNRVHPMHARKMAALLQQSAGNDFAEDPIMLWVDREGGHGAGKPLSLRIRESADIWSFVMWQTGMKPGPRG